MIKENSYFIINENSFNKNKEYIKSSFQINSDFDYDTIEYYTLLKTDSLIVHFFNKKYANQYLSIKDYDIQLIPVDLSGSQEIYGIMFLREDNKGRNLCNSYTMPFGGNFSVIRFIIGKELKEYKYGNSK